MRKKNQGKQEEKDLENGLSACFGKRVFVQRLKDTHDAIGRNKRFVVVDAVPSDFLITLNGRMAYLECKKCDNKTSFPFSNITTSQRNAYTKQIAAGGIYLFAIVHNKQWYILPAQVIKNTTDRKSIPWRDLDGFKIKSFKEIERHLCHNTTME